MYQELRMMPARVITVKDEQWYWAGCLLVQCLTDLMLEEQGECAHHTSGHCCAPEYTDQCYSLLAGTQKISSETPLPLK